MNKKIFIPLSILALLFLFIFSVFLSQAARPEALTRQLDPVVLTGDQLSPLLGTATNEIFAYAFTGGVPAQIPFQVDEQNADGMFIPNGDGLLDSTEELVFMAKDAGDYEPDPLLPTPGGDIYPGFVITLSDPLSSEQAWAYIYTSPDLTPTFAGDYVSYDSGNDRILSAGVYSVGFNSTNAFRDFMALGNGVDILDRDKIRLDGYAVLPIFDFHLTENDFTKDAVHALDGPVRVTRVVTSTVNVGGTPITGSGPTFFYQTLISQPLALTTPPSPVVVQYLRNSVDLNAAASGMVYYDPNNAGGKTIDGSPDTLIITPAAEWQQVGGSDGTMITMVDLPDTLPNMSTYYKDNNIIDPNDTGDQMSYGDTGFQVDNPPQSQSFDLLIQTAFLSGAQANVGTTYYTYYLNPLDVQVDVFGLPTPTPTSTSTATETPTPTMTATPTATPTITPTPPVLFPRLYLPLVLQQ